MGMGVSEVFLRDVLGVLVVSQGGAPWRGQASLAWKAPLIKAFHKRLPTAERQLPHNERCLLEGFGWGIDFRLFCHFLRE